ncbi:hypothetical protein [Acinetobacter sp. WCHAc010052]|uniref:hypothetical protein n=1 Tax=Acinetobacter sp. WCHAc010052 TaxID=2004647 RepID=UPI000B3CAD02|nr:hypothetical protein [Acinetobacter sp. WCHAc010052]AXY60181.1 hypothetical protein CDG61_09170 [Acinetobacter sp. WCHAc010052]
MTIYQAQPSNIDVAQTEYRTFTPTNGIKAHYRDSADVNSGTHTKQADSLKFDLTYGFNEQILSKSVRFKLGNETFVDNTGTVLRNVDPGNGSGISSGQIHYGSGEIELASWTPGVANTLKLESLITTTDLPPINHVSFRTPVVPIRPGSLTVVIASVAHGQLTLRFNEDGVIETVQAHGRINYITGFVDIYFYTKTEMTEVNRSEIISQQWYDPLLEYSDGEKSYVNVPVWVLPDSVRYNAVAYTYIPLDSEILGLSATRLPLDGRVPIFRVGGIGIVSSSKSMDLLDHVAGKTYSLPDQRISWCELEDSAGVKVPFDMYVVDYDYGKFTLNGDFAVNALVPPFKAKYRYQDMGLIRDVQINGQITFTKPVTHNYEAENTIVGTALVIGEMQSRYTGKFVQQTWNSIWADEPTGAAISANYNDALYPIAITNQGAIQERWAIVFTTDTTSFKCIGEYTGELTIRGTTMSDYSPPNPVTGAPYFTIKKEGWGAGWVSGNVLRFNTVAANFPVWCIRTVKQSEPSVISDKFQIMLRGDIDRVI